MSTSVSRSIIGGTSWLVSRNVGRHAPPPESEARLRHPTSTIDLDQIEYIDVIVKLRMSRVDLRGLYAVPCPETASASRKLG